MKKHPEVIRLHRRTRPFWARLRRVLEKANPTDDNLKDVDIIDQAVHAALMMLDPDPANADENSLILSLDGLAYIIPRDGGPKKERVPILPEPLTDTIMARLNELEANVKTLMEKHE